MNLPLDFALLIQYLETLGLKDVFLFVLLLGPGLFFTLTIIRTMAGTDGYPSVMSNVIAIGSSINIENSQQDDDEQPAAWDDDTEEYSSWDYDTDEESEPAPVLPQVFSPCPKCGAPRKSFECEYCHQVAR